MSSSLENKSFLSFWQRLYEGFGTFYFSSSKLQPKAINNIVELEDMEGTLT